MKVALAVTALLLVAACGPFGDSGMGAGKKACETYQEALNGAPEAITDMDALGDIKLDLSDLDDETRRAFGALISAADANPFLDGADPYATDKAAAKVRAVCLSEHSIDIPN